MKQLHNLTSKRYPQGRRIARTLDRGSVLAAIRNSEVEGFNYKFLGRSAKEGLALKAMVTG